MSALTGFAAAFKAWQNAPGTEIIVDAITIKDRAGLESIAQNPSGSYILTADIDLGGEPWTPFEFSGSLDGAGHALLNLTIRDYDPVTAVSVDGNNKRYDTVFAALFSRTYGATIENLTLLGVDVDVTTDKNSFAAGLVGYAEGVQIKNCTVRGRVKLDMTGRMCGVAGVLGFGYSTVADCSVSVTLTLVDSNHEINCEEFMGAILATGYADISGCGVYVRAYTSVYGYVHNGGIAGMYYVHTDDYDHNGFVKDNVVDAEIYFFEANIDRRAYCAPYVGERLNNLLRISDNTTTNFVNGETFDYSKTLFPESCDRPEYTEKVAAPGCSTYGFTIYTCAFCNYTFDTAYTLPMHSSGEWITVRELPENTILRQQLCLVCGESLIEEEYRLPDPVQDIPVTPDEPQVEDESLPIVTEEPKTPPTEDVPGSDRDPSVGVMLLILRVLLMALVIILPLARLLKRR